MFFKVSVVCAVVYLLSVCSGHENTTQEKLVSNETLVPASNKAMIEDIDLDPDASISGLWRRFWNWGQYIYFSYLLKVLFGLLILVASLSYFT